MNNNTMANALNNVAPVQNMINYDLDSLVYPQKYISGIKAGFFISHVGIMNNTSATLYISQQSTPGNIPRDSTEIGAYQTRSFPIHPTAEIFLYWSGEPQPNKLKVSVVMSNAPVELYGATFDPTVTNQQVTIKGGQISVDNFPTQQHVVVDNTANVKVTNFPATQEVTGNVGVSGTVNVGNLPATQTVQFGSVPTVSLGKYTASGAAVPVIGAVQISGMPNVSVRTWRNYMAVSNQSSSSTITMAVLEKIIVTKASSKAGNTITVTYPEWAGIPAGSFDVDISQVGTYDIGYQTAGSTPVSVTFKQNGANNIEAANVLIMYQT